MNEKMNLDEHAISQAEKNILNALHIAIYVTDLVTNEILYANMALRRKHSGPLLGRICWEALENKNSRCEFCPIPYLMKHPGEDYDREVYNNCHYKVYDSIIPWENGKLAHLRYVVDITYPAKQ